MCMWPTSVKSLGACACTYLGLQTLQAYVLQVQCYTVKWKLFHHHILRM